MRYLRTKLATDWPRKEPWQVKLISCILFFIPRANPDYDRKMHLVKEWLIEFEDHDTPWREIAIGADGTPLFAGPGNGNYGFWLDTNMKYENFEGDTIDKSEFERLWKISGVTTPET
jgi:hypothetical protein